MKNDATTATDCFNTRLGWVAIAANPKGVVRATLPEPTPETALESLSDHSSHALENTVAGTTDPASDDISSRILANAKTLITRYCDGENVDLDDIPIDDTDWTPYTRRARAACRAIPRGQTKTYAWLAEQASGNANSARAAGRAMATNPVPIIIPCHRVIASNGKLQGFGGSIGTPLKQRLLEMENAFASPSPLMSKGE